MSVATEAIRFLFGTILNQQLRASVKLSPEGNDPAGVMES